MRELSDSELVERLKTSVREERRLAAEILEFLKEVDRRRLYAEYGCSSMWEFLVKELQYSEAAAYRRVAAMRLVREMPELKQDLVEGKQSLSSLAQAQKFFRTEEKQQGRRIGVEAMKEVLEKLENKSSRECERELLKLSSSPITISHPERERVVTEEHTELKLVVDAALLEKLKRIQALRSHANLSMSYAELLEFMADEVLKRLDPEVKAREKAERQAARKTPSNPNSVDPARATPPAPPTSEVGRSDQAASPSNSTQADGYDPAAENFFFSPKRLPIPAALRDEVWLRDRGSCTWRDSRTGKVCGTRSFLEMEHLTPVARGGTNSRENLTLRCRAHNARAAVKEFGADRAQPARN